MACDPCYGVVRQLECLFFFFSVIFASADTEGLEVVFWIVSSGSAPVG